MIRTLTLAVLALALAAPAPAQVQRPCLPHDVMAAKLEARFREQQIGIGAVPSGQAVFELFVAETGTWTLLMTRPNGMSCITASGYGWEISPLRQGDPS